MESYHRAGKLLCTIVLSLLFLLYCNRHRASASPLHSSPSSAFLAGDALSSRGYSLFASAILSSTNFSGTVFAAPDFATTELLNNRNATPSSLLLYHTLQPPLVLSWHALLSLPDGDEVSTLYDNHCLYLYRSTSDAEVTIASSPLNNALHTVKIRQPDIYVDDHLTVHGIDAVLDPSIATKCHTYPIDHVAHATPRQGNRTFLDHAIRALKRTGYNVVAAAMSVRRSKLLNLTSATVFAVSDVNMFSEAGGFCFDFDHHVVPMRHRIADLNKTATNGSEFITLSPNKTVFIDAVDGVVRAGGSAVGLKEVYHNRWIVVISIKSSLDDVVNASIIRDFGGDSENLAPAPFSGTWKNRNSHITLKAPSPAVYVNTMSPSPSPVVVAARDLVSSPMPTQAIDGVMNKQCNINAVVSGGVEEGVIRCPTGSARQLQETSDMDPLDGDFQNTEDLTQKVNTAGDLFFYN